MQADAATNFARSETSHFHELISVLAAGLITCDRDGRITFFNERAAELLHYHPKPGETLAELGRSFKIYGGDGELISPDLYSLGICLRQGTSFFNQEVLIERPDGTRFVSVFNTEAARDASRRIVSASCAFQDITERKEAEQRANAHARFLNQLNRQLIQLRDPLEIISAASRLTGEHLGAQRCYFCEWMEDQQHVVVAGDWCEDESLHVAGVHDLNIFGPKEWLAILAFDNMAVEDVEREEVTRDFLPNYRALKVRSYATSRLLQLNGSMITLALTHASPRIWRADELKLLEDVCYRAWSLVERARSDKTLKESEEQLRLALSTADMGHWKWFPASDEVVLSKRAAEIFNIPAEKTITRTALRALLHPDDQERALNAMLRTIEDDVDYDIEYRLNTPGAKEVWISAKGRASRDAEGRAIGMLGVVQNISERKAAEQNLQNQNERLKLLSEALVYLLSARNPDHIVRDLLPKVAAHLGTDTYLNFMVNRTGQKLELHAVAGIPDQFLAGLQTLDFGQAICGTVAQTRQPIHAQDIQNSSYDKADLVRSMGIQAYACNPFIIGDTLLGTLSFATRNRTAFDESEVAFTRTISQYLSLAIDRARSEKAVRESAERLTAALSAASAGTFRWNIKRGTEEFDEKLERLFGIAPHEKIETLNDFFACVHPEDRPEVVASVEKCARDGSDFNMEFRVVWPDGSVHWLDDRGKTFFDADGQPDYMTGACVEITASKIKQIQIRQQRDVLETIVSGEPLPEILERLMAGVEKIAERKVIATLLLVSPDGLVFRPAAGKSAPERWTKYLLHLEAPAAGDPYSPASYRRESMVVEDISTDESWAVHSHEAVRQGLRACWSTPVLSAKGKPLGLFMVYRGEAGKPTPAELEVAEIVTRTAAIAIEKSHADLALKESQYQLQEYAHNLELRVEERTASLRDAVQQMEEFSYSVSHDLRAPVRAMHGYAKALLSDYGERLDGEGQHFLNRIITAGTRMERLINDTLTYSRLTRSQITVQPIALEKLVSDLIDNSPEFQAPRAHIVIKSPLLDVTAHDTSLTQSIFNLLGNAVKFVPPGRLPSVTVSTEAVEGAVKIWFADNGIGIKPEHQGRLFGMFERIHPAEKYEGTGIGLAIVRKAVEKMGGKVGLVSDGLNGSRFWLQLPAAKRA